MQASIKAKRSVTSLGPDWVGSEVYSVLGCFCEDNDTRL